MFKFVNNSNFVWSLQYRKSCFVVTSTHQLKQIAIRSLGKSNNEHMAQNKSSVLNIMVTRSIRVLTSATDVVLASGTTGEGFTSCIEEAVWVTNAHMQQQRKHMQKNYRAQQRHRKKVTEVTLCIKEFQRFQNSIN